MKRTVLILIVMMGMLVASYAVAQTQNPMVSPIVPPGKDYHGRTGRSGTGEALTPEAPETQAPNPMVSPIVPQGKDYHGRTGRSGTGEAMQGNPETEGKNVMISPILPPDKDWHGRYGRSGTGEALQPFAK